MPAMVRKRGKALGIAYSLNKVPDNIRFPRSIFSKRVKRKLMFEDGRLSKG